MGIREGGGQIFYRFKGGRDQKSLRTTGLNGSIKKLSQKLLCFANEGSSGYRKVRNCHLKAE